MADIQTVTKGAQKAAKQVKANDALRKPAGLALAGAALAAIPYAAEKLGPKLSGKAGDVAGSAKDKAKVTAVAARVVGRPERAATALGLAVLELGLAVAAGAAVARRPSRSRRTAP